MFCEVFKTERLSVLWKAQKGVEKGHVDIHVFAELTVIPSGSCWAVDYVLSFVILAQFP